MDQVNDDGDLGGQVPRSTNLTALGRRRGCSVLARMEKWLRTHSWGLITRKAMAAIVEVCTQCVGEDVTTGENTQLSILILQTDLKSITLCYSLTVFLPLEVNIIN